MFVIASGHAPVRAAASSEMGIPATHVVPPLSTQSILIALLLSILTVITAVTIVKFMTAIVKVRMRMSPMNATAGVTQ
eukprot:2813981-Amphidinium_carterae.1